MTIVTIEYRGANFLKKRTSCRPGSLFFIFLNWMIELLVLETSEK